MKKILIFILAITMVVSLALPFASFAETSVTEIASAADLAKVKDDLSGHYKLTANISGAAQIPGEFKGVFDGNGKTVSGLTSALFECVAGGTVKNLTVEATINVVTTAEDADSAIAVVAEWAKSGAAFDTVTANGSITADLSATFADKEFIGGVYVGGIVGTAYNNGKDSVIALTKCTNNAVINVKNSSKYFGVAGIIGASYQNDANNVGTIKIHKCVNKGNITVDGGSASAAGIIARFSEKYLRDENDTAIVYNDTAFISKCANIGNITVNNGTSEGTGGIVGYFREGTISRCYNVGELVNSKGTSGLVAYANCKTADPGQRVAIIEYCYNATSAKLNTELASIKGTNSESVVRGNCYLTGRTSHGDIKNFADPEIPDVECANEAAILEALKSNGYTANTEGFAYPVLEFQAGIDDGDNLELPAPPASGDIGDTGDTGNTGDTGDTGNTGGDTGTTNPPSNDNDKKDDVTDKNDKTDNEGDKENSNMIAVIIAVVAIVAVGAAVVVVVVKKKNS